LKKNNSIITVKADLPAYGGFALARGNGCILLIRNAIPGETVEARIDEQKNDHAFASVVRVLAASPDRIEPPCQVFGICGGCQIQYVSYPRQVAMKEEILLDCLRRIAKKQVDLSDPLVGNSPWNYRHRGQFKIGKGSFGFYREKSRDVIDFDYCPIMNNEVNHLFSKAREVYKSSRTLFDGISEFHISCGDEGLAFLKSTTKISTARWNQIGMLLLEAGFGGVSGTSGNGKVVTFGSEHMTLELEGLKYTVSPLSFFQSNWHLNQTLVRFILKSMQPISKKRVIDLYSGAGNFSLPFALNGADVYAIEENPEAIVDGKRNAALNGIKNCRFIACSAERLKVCDTVDILVVDPPRPGLTNSALDKILVLEPERIAYISCNPSTLARDIKKLLGQYDIESMRVIDFFPQTYHIESLAVLRLR
jgi:23S rRNA (uracil1939-C5)-methyltransferase